MKTMCVLACAVAMLGCGGGGAGTRTENPPDLQPEPLPPEMAGDAGPDEPDAATGTSTDSADAPSDAGVVAATDAAAPAADAAVVGDAAPADPAAAWNAKVEHGRRRYNRLCYVACHDPSSGYDAPNLVGRRLAERRIRTQVRQGGREMDPIPVRRLSEEDLDAIIAYLSTVNGVRDFVQPPGATKAP